uniref:Uncharacterized protein n=1 Tax=Rhizophora mucronata TaxID=61149 RepID=A0A2P2R0J2_RHIMU
MLTCVHLTSRVVVKSFKMRTRSTSYDWYDY